MLLAAQPVSAALHSSLRLLPLPRLLPYHPFLRLGFPKGGQQRCHVPCQYPCVVGSVSTPRVPTSLRGMSSKHPNLTPYRFGPGVSLVFTCCS